MTAAPRKALVTGASSGIGEACARALGRSGHELLLIARRADRLEHVAASLREAGSHVIADVVDVRDRDAVNAWAERRAAELAGLDVLVNNAGLARGFGPLGDNDPDDWDEMIDTNVKGLLHVTRAVLPHLTARGRGDVINIGSVAGRWVYPGGAVYCGSKFAERAITEGLRLDLLGTGVRACTVDPGMVETEFSLVRFHGDAPRAEAVYRGVRPLTADDVASAVAWVASQPPHVNVAELVLYPTDQASPTLVKRR